MTIDCCAHIGLSDGGVFYSYTDLISKMDALKIGKALISCLSGADISAQNDYVWEAAQKFPKQLLPVMILNPLDKNAEQELCLRLEEQKFKAVRFYAQRHGYYPDNCTALSPLLQLIEGYGVPVIAHTGLSALGTPQQWSFYAEDFPRITFIFNHMGLFDFGYGCIDLAKKLPNLYLETSGQFEVQILDKALKELPANKLLFGTDWPFKVAEIEFSKFDMFGIDDRLKNNIFGANAASLFQILS